MCSRFIFDVRLLTFHLQYYIRSELSGERQGNLELAVQAFQEQLRNAHSQEASGEEESDDRRMVGR